MLTNYDLQYIYIVYFNGVSHYSSGPLPVFPSTCLKYSNFKTIF